MIFGIVKHWDELKGFGFITTDEGDDVFLHASNLAAPLDARRIQIGMRVKFDVRSDIKGDHAVNVRKA